jgi:FkbM family methyltransferase
MRGALKTEPRAERPRYVDDTRALLLELQARGFEARTVLDVGASDGRWSAMAAERFPKARFFLIEARAEMRGPLDAFCERHPGSRWLQAGAGAAAGERLLTIREDRHGSSFLPAASLDEARSGRQRSVPVVTIDSLLDGAGMAMPNLVKLDVQGFELEVLRGGRHLFGAVEVFIVETSFFRFLPGMPLFHEVIAFMADRGYYAYDFAGSLRRPYDGALGQTDICFARDGGMLRASVRWA